MFKNLLVYLLFLSSFIVSGQVVINELDTDTPGTDDKEFIELKSVTPNFSLSNYVLVLFNGSPTSSDALKSYYAMDLDGMVTDVNGILLIGNDLVSPVPSVFLPVSTMQNGADGIALYLGSAADFPDETLANSTNLIDAIAYDTSDANATELMALLGLTEQIDENVNSLATIQSIQRKNDGTYEVKMPTPGANNDGSGILFNGITISVAANIYNEGDSFNITFTPQNLPTSDLNFTFSLNNAGFNTADYVGGINVSIPAGYISASTQIILTDDAANEGDELAKVKFGPLPSGYNRLNDNIEIRVIDNDFTTSPWGTPLNPTYGIVSSTAPAGYYASLEGKSGALLKQAIQDIIASPAVHAHNYGDMEFVLKEADQNPLNSNQVWLMYVEQGRAKYKFQTTASNIGSWNREHIYPQSRGGFADGTDSDSDGITNWAPTDADDLQAGHADAHHIRAEDGPENSSRGNSDYGLDDYDGPAGSQGSWHGDVARSLFYMAVRYNELGLTNGNLPDATLYQMGDLATLLQWNASDPRDDYEMHRNNVVYTWQINRNPFIDNPNLADYVFGASIGLPWFAPLSRSSFSSATVALYPNPATDQITLEGFIGHGNLSIFSVAGANLHQSDFVGKTTINLNLAPGMYLAKITCENRSVIKKIIVR